MHFNNKHILFIIAIFLGCEKTTTFNPLDSEHNPDFIPPDTFLISDEIEGSIFDISSITIEWEGSESVTEFSYNLDGLEWSNWSTNTAVTLEYLDEGAHVFYVKGRSPSKEGNTVSVSFAVDVMSGPGLRVHKWLSTPNVMDMIDIDIYAEEVTGLVLAEFQVTYDSNYLSLVSSDKGAIFEGIETSAFVQESVSGILKVNFTTLEHSGLTGTGSILKFQLQVTHDNSCNSLFINIENPILKDIDGNNFEEDINIRNGEVIIDYGECI